MTPVLLDAGCIVALLDRDERHHENCVDAFRTLSGPVVTCEPVIAESCHLLRKQAGATNAILENVERGVFRLPVRLEEIAAPVRTLMRRYARVPMDLADACLVAMAEVLETGRILTLDDDFRIYRWKQTKGFEILIDR